MSEHHHEILIIHRGGHDDHDEHHGGVWKIAFADFMTAMMAFFLVLWLVSANDKTRASVAHYFNPVHLVDATVQPRGLYDAKKEDTGFVEQTGNQKPAPELKKGKTSDKLPATSQPQTAQNAGPGGDNTPKGREKRLDAELRDNPYVALAEIAGEKGPGEPTVKDGNAPAPLVGHGGPAFRDPFAPPPPRRMPDGKLDPDDKDEILIPASAPPPNAAEKLVAADAHANAAASPVQAPAAPSSTDAPSPKATDAKGTKDIAALKTSLVSALRGLLNDRAAPELDVRHTREGTLVSLTDTSDFTMFSNGSAVPTRKVVLMMEKIASRLKDVPGEIVVRGFTDSKKFHSTRYDNWHLSLDRAQVAHYMLVRGGLPDARLSHVEGYADHETKSGLEPSNPRNRRIEILIKDAPA